MNLRVSRGSLQRHHFGKAGVAPQPPRRVSDAEHELIHHNRYQHQVEQVIRPRGGVRLTAFETYFWRGGRYTRIISE